MCLISNTQKANVVWKFQKHVTCKYYHQQSTTETNLIIPVHIAVYVGQRYNGAAVYLGRILSDRTEIKVKLGMVKCVFNKKKELLTKGKSLDSTRQLTRTLVF